MSHLGYFNFSSLKSLQNSLALLGDPQSVIDDCAYQLAQRLLQLAADRTPVGQYPVSSGKVGGTLKNGWQIGDIQRSGNTVSVEVFNPVPYAHFVEFGHKTPNASGWVNGRFMLKLSAQELQAITSEIVLNSIDKYLSQLVT